MDYNLIIDIENRRLVAGFDSTEAGAPPAPVFGDQPTVNVQLVESNNDNAEHPWKSVANSWVESHKVFKGLASYHDKHSPQLAARRDELAHKIYKKQGGTRYWLGSIRHRMRTTQATTQPITA